MSDAHKAKDKPPRSFCVERVKKCKPHGYKYREADDVSWPQFPRLFRFQEYASWSRGWFPGKRQIVEIHKRQVKHNAHHCVPCASVANNIVSVSEIQITVNKTSWCINHKANMIALPLWGHTFIWYVNQMGELMKDRTAPEFVDRPMHDCGHGKYNTEVDLEMQDIAKKIKKNNKAHKHRVKELKAALNAEVKHFKGEVKRRGKREGGTHTAWQKAVQDKNYSTWYMPFSLADDGDVDERVFPCHQGSGENLQDKISAWLEAIWFAQ